MGMGTDPLDQAQLAATVRGFCDPIEEITGRKVRAFLSGIDTEVDGLSAEVFVLHPDGYDGPSRTELAGVRSPRPRPYPVGVRRGREGWHLRGGPRSGDGGAADLR
jgi:hypothetical protein